MGEFHSVLNTALQVEFGATQEKQWDPTVSFTTPVPTQKTDGTKVLDLNIIVADQNSQDLMILIEYGVSDTGPWNKATITGTPTVTYGATPDVDNGETYPVGTNTGVETDTGDNTVGLDWEVDADLAIAGTYYLKATVEDTNGDIASIVSVVFSVDAADPVNDNVTLEIDPPVALLDTVSISADWTEDNPDTNFARIKVNGGAAVETAGATDTVDMVTVLAAAGVTLYGDDYVQVGARHNDDFGNTTTTDLAPLEYVAPAAPVVPVASQTGKTTADVAPVDNVDDAAGISGSFEHAIRITGDTTGWINAVGAVVGAEVWQTVAAWGTTGITGLTANGTYELSSKSRNPNSTAVESALSTASEITTESLDPVVGVPAITEPTDGLGVYIIDSTLQDDNTVISIVVEYWDGAAWQATSNVTGDVGPFNDVPPAAATKAISLLWDALPQFLVDGVDQTDAKIKITASDGTNTGSAESVVFDLDTTLPDVNVGTILTVTGITLTQQTLSWDIAATDTNFDTYELYFSEISFADALAKNGIKWDDGDDALLGTNTTLTTDVTGLSSDTDYYVALLAVDTLGNTSNEPIVTLFHTGVDAVLRVIASDQSDNWIPAAVVYVYQSSTGLLVVESITNADGYVDVSVYDINPKFVVIQKAGYGSYVLDDQIPVLV